jgi:hypothetical protein
MKKEKIWTKTCRGCGVEMPLDCFGVHHQSKMGHHARCHRCMRDDWYQRQYGVGVDYFEERLKEQKQRCVTCGEGFDYDPYHPDKTSSTRPVLDHDRMTGRARGVLCLKCSSVLAILEDDTDLIRSLTRYIHRWTKT